MLWTLQPTTISGNCCRGVSGQATVQGTYLFDWETFTYSNWNLTVSGYPQQLESMNVSYTPANSTTPPPSPYILQLYDTQMSQYLSLSFGSLGSYSYGSYGSYRPPPITTRQVQISNGSGFYSFFASGNGVVVSSVPEPLTGVLVLVGAAALCLRDPRRWRSRRPGRTSLSQ